MEIVCLAAEVRVVRHMHHQIQVAGFPSCLARIPLARHADARTLPHSRRDFDIQPLGLGNRALAMTGGTQLIVLQPGSMAGRTFLHRLNRKIAFHTSKRFLQGDVDRLLHVGPALRHLGPTWGLPAAKNRANVEVECTGLTGRGALTSK